mmetsp:Transcript_29191/g.53484  ORF Transcript_29191/g.53484 Transcript_29191/m.53484 type:complete len:271 (+) Transcript_29191:252-1064(+)
MRVSLSLSLSCHFATSFLRIHRSNYYSCPILSPLPPPLVFSRRDAYFMRKDFQNGIASETSSQVQQQPKQNEQQQQQQQLRRGEKERNEWLNRDATRSGSFFDNRKSMRDTISEEERAWIEANDDINNNDNGNTNANPNPPASSTATANSSRNALSGKFQRSFRTFLNGGERLQQLRRQQQQRLQQGQYGRYQSPPWETGPEGLRLPRYCEVTRPAAASPATTSETNAAGEISRGNSLRDLASNNDSFDGEEEGEVLSALEDAHVATGSV